MKVIRNNLIPFKGFVAINLFGVLFVRSNAKINAVTLNHEQIHTRQMREMLYLPFYLWYLMEWIVRLMLPGNAYRNISLEREAYGQQTDLSYLCKRKPYGWLQYLKPMDSNLNKEEQK